MRAFKFVIPIMLIVGSISWIMLERSHTEVPESSRLLITIGAIVVSGVISHFLFPKNESENEE